jgi:hypothetical protein
VTSESAKAMLNFNKERSEKNKEHVFFVVSVLGSALPYEITKYIQEEALKAASTKFFVKGDKKEIENYVKKNSIHIRTVRRKLKELVNEGRLVKKGDGKYAVSDLALSDLRFFTGKSATVFGQAVLSRMLSIHYPTVTKMKDNLKNLVEIFGLYVLYCLLEATRPIPDTKQKPQDYFSKMFKDKLTVKWLEKVVDTKYMLDAYLSALTNQLSDKEVAKVNKKHMIPLDDDTCIYKNNSEDEFKGPPSTHYFQGKRSFYITSKKGQRDYRKTNTPALRNG